MTRKLILVPLMALGLVFAAAGTATAATPTQVRGLWTSVDPADGSNQTLVVAGGGAGTFRLVYFDDNATVACDSVPALLTGQATLSGDTLSGSISGICFDGTWTGPFDVSYTYDAGPPETLTDGFGGVWTGLFD